MSKKRDGFSTKPDGSLDLARCMDGRSYDRNIQRQGSSISDFQGSINCPDQVYDVQESYVCLDGGIYTREKCHVCGGNLRQNASGRGMFCPYHPEIKATTFIVRFPGGVYKTFHSYMDANFYLALLRHQKETQVNFGLSGQITSNPS